MKIITLFLMIGILNLFSNSTIARTKSYETKAVSKETNRNLQQQKIRITGKVAGKNGEALVGVTVSVKGTSRGGISDLNGSYSISINSTDKVLVFSFIGMIKKEVTIGDQKSINVVMEEESTALGEVVVVGYGIQKKAELTDAVSNVDFNKLENTPQSNTLNVLEGRIAGLSVVQASGQPGDNNNEVNIRGVNTLNDASPLVIIDGVQSTLKDLSTLTSREISNISVLKDASSTAIYGARGANGVILVTTKAPKAGKIAVNFSSYMGVQQGTYLPQFVISWQWMTLMNEATGTHMYPQRAIDSVKKGIVSDTFANYNPVKTVFHDAPITNYNLSLSGGNEKLTYQASLAYLKQDGIMYNTNSERYNYRTNVNAIISNKFQIGLNLSGYLQNNHQSYYGPQNTLTQLYRTYPITPNKYSTNGSPGVYSLYDGTTILPADVYTMLGRSDTKNQKSNFQTYAQLNLLKGLVFKTNISYSIQTTTGVSFLPTYSFPDASGKPASVNNINTLSNSSNESTQLQISSTGNYSFKITPKGNATLLVGYEFTSYNQSYFAINGSNLPDNDHQVLDRATTNFTPWGNSTAWKLQSFFTRFNYSFSGKYMFGANLRTDGSSRFPESNRYSYFPSVSVGWNIAEEEFFKPLRKDGNLFDMCKFRASYGNSGNDRIGDFSSQQSLSLSNYYYFGGTLIPGAAETSYANTNINWETSATKNIGLDLGMFKSRLMLNVDYYDKLTTGILYRLQMPPSFGSISPAIQNVANVNNRGYEITLQFKSSIKKLNFNIGGNLAYNKNKIVKLNGLTAINNANILEEGQDINSFYGYVANDLFRTADDVANYPSYATGFKLGSLKYEDLNKDGKIDDKDRTIIGTGSTPYTFGVTGSLSYKNFDMSFMIQGVRGKSVYTHDWGNRPANGKIMEFWKEWWDNRFDPVNNPNGTYPALGRSVPSPISTFYIRDASYVRLKNVEIGYNLPHSFLSKLSINNIRFYVTAQNLYTFTSLIPEIDPERLAMQSGNTSYPQTKLFTAGINASF